eukprot:1780891-Prymnesium_polylepis.1
MGWTRRAFSRENIGWVCVSRAVWFWVVLCALQSQRELPFHHGTHHRARLPVPPPPSNAELAGVPDLQRPRPQDSCSLILGHVGGGDTLGGRHRPGPVGPVLRSVDIDNRVT